jgi:molybdopterin-binding protein
MELSARNQLQGMVRSVKAGTVMAEVVVIVGDQQITSAITQASAERLDLKEGDQVTVIVKATDIMIAKA